jgi:ankyrin repeat protein
MPFFKKTPEVEEFEAYAKLEQGKFEANVQNIIKLSRKVDKNGWNLLHHAAKEGNVDLVDLLMASDDTKIDTGNKKGSTPLMIAAFYNQSDVVDKLLAGGASIDQADRRGRTPLIIAAEKNHAEITGQLLAKGANVNAEVTTGQDQGYTPLIIAAEKNHAEITGQLLAKGANVNAEVTTGQDQGYTPLMIAAKKGHAVVAEQLLAKGADVNTARTKNKKGGNGETALILAAANGHEAVVGQLLVGGASIDQADQDGITPLHLASSIGHEAVVEQLLVGGASCSEKDNNGNVALHHAAANGQEGAYSLLSKGGHEYTMNKRRNCPKKLIEAHRRKAAKKAEVVAKAGGIPTAVAVEDTEGGVPMAAAVAVDDTAGGAEAAKAAGGAEAVPSAPPAAAAEAKQKFERGLKHITTANQIDPLNQVVELINSTTLQVLDTVDWSKSRLNTKDFKRVGQYKAENYAEETRTRMNEGKEHESKAIEYIGKVFAAKIQVAVKGVIGVEAVKAKQKFEEKLENISSESRDDSKVEDLVDLIDKTPPQVLDIVDWSKYHADVITSELLNKVGQYKATKDQESIEFESQYGDRLGGTGYDSPEEIMIKGKEFAAKIDVAVKGVKAVEEARAVVGEAEGYELVAAVVEAKRAAGAVAHDAAAEAAQRADQRAAAKEHKKTVMAELKDSPVTLKSTDHRLALEQAEIAQAAAEANPRSPANAGIAATAQSGAEAAYYRGQVAGGAAAAEERASQAAAAAEERASQAAAPSAPPMPPGGFIPMAAAVPEDSLAVPLAAVEAPPSPPQTIELLAAIAKTAAARQAAEAEAARQAAEAEAVTAAIPSALAQPAAAAETAMATVLAGAAEATAARQAAEAEAARQAAAPVPSALAQPAAAEQAELQKIADAPLPPTTPPDAEAAMLASLPKAPQGQLRTPGLQQGSHRGREMAKRARQTPGGGGQVPGG